MTLNADNAMARFLFAILKQKNLKDIDWNQVAEDPVLLQPITNGHAARMRYARFRSTILGHEPTKRSKGDDKSRVSKSKKSSSSKKGVIVKSESGVSLSSYAQFSPASMASMTSPYMDDTKDDFNTRFLTPCSDDMIQPASLHRNPNGFASATMDCGSDFLTHADADHVVMAHSPTFSAFDAAYDLSGYSGGSSDIRDLSGNQSVLEAGGDWADRFHDQPLF